LAIITPWPSAVLLVHLEADRLRAAHRSGVPLRHASFTRWTAIGAIPFADN
jgi:hypothetical protein